MTASTVSAAPNVRHLDAAVGQVIRRLTRLSFEQAAQLRGTLDDDAFTAEEVDPALAGVFLAFAALVDAPLDTLHARLDAGLTQVGRAAQQLPYSACGQLTRFINAGRSTLADTPAAGAFLDALLALGRDVAAPAGSATHPTGRLTGPRR